jgi:hypothetical protein
MKEMAPMASNSDAPGLQWATRALKNLKDETGDGKAYHYVCIAVMVRAPVRPLRAFRVGAGQGRTQLYIQRDCEDTAPKTKVHAPDVACCERSGKATAVPRNAASEQTCSIFQFIVAAAVKEVGGHDRTMAR